MPRSVAPATSTLVGSPRVEPMTRRPASRTAPVQASASHTTMSAPSSAMRAASASSFISLSGVCSIHGS